MNEIASAIVYGHSCSKLDKPSFLKVAGSIKNNAHLYFYVHGKGNIKSSEKFAQSILTDNLSLERINQPYNMKRSLLYIFLVVVPLLSFAQASGGQIRRPNQTNQNSQSNSQRRLSSHIINNHDYVDLGLRVKWATCNIWASKPQESGSYFAWGETKPKSDYSWKTYFDLVGGSSNSHLSDPDYSYKKDDFVKYNRFTNLKIGRNYDAASVQWGGSWRTPSHEDFNELWSLPHQLVCIEGEYGMKFTSSNGTSLFLPATGGMKDGKLDNAQEVALYWMNELHEDDYDCSELAKMWFMDKDDGGWSFALRCFGFPIRPVAE